MTRRETAIENFKKGYNCSQAVLLAFQDILPVDETYLSKIACSFGGGMGRLREVCGAVSGMLMAAGLLYGYDGPDKGDKKAEQYKKVQELALPFEEKHGSLICRDLLHLEVHHDGPIPTPRTQQFYEKRPCEEFIGTAAELLDAFLKEHPVEKDA